VVLMGAGPAPGCGPDFPNWLLAQGDQSVLVAPEGDFAAELAHVNLGRTRVHAVPLQGTAGYSEQSTEAELADLRKALKQANVPDAEAGRIINEHQRQRQQLAEFIDARQNWRESNGGEPDDAAPATDGPKVTGPAFVNVEVAEGLPAEFADYFEGFIRWHNPAVKDKQAARAAWERLLGRPEEARQYKSTWAAFMLGKSWEKEDPDKAVSYFKQVRDLARTGFRDTLGVAAASLGLEARVRLAQAKFEPALELYLEQMSSGDPTATNSLAFAAARALAAEPGALQVLAKNSRCQKVITAYVISRTSHDSIFETKPKAPDELPAAGAAEAVRWLNAVEQAEVTDVDSAEALALAAYRANQMDAAQRWIKRAPKSPLSQWLQAKLLLRAGKLRDAAALLAQISPQFPIVHVGTNAPAPADRKDTLKVGGDYYRAYQTSAERQVHGELGVLRLARGEYSQALDSLLNARFWMDAAYVGERVLTLDELKGYVDHFWPAASADQVAEEKERFGASEVSPALLREQIRYLLARRLTRESHSDQAREYYPADWLGAFDQFTTALRAGWDEAGQPPDRAMAFFTAALLLRTNGMELIGTEVAPDWHYHQGRFEEGVIGSERVSNDLARVVRPSPDELRRDAEHHPNPNERFHYRYQAASLAWEAARLLPDNDDRTAYILWQGGTFLKYRDPQFADIFYKALVNRNRKTILGAEADRQRWFPLIDENGNILPRKAKPTVPEAEPETPRMEGAGANETIEPAPEQEVQPAVMPDKEAPDPGEYVEYVVRSGDSLAGIARNTGVMLRDLLQSNPGLDGNRLRVGQRLLIPQNP
jgi:LysM repeat protein